MNGNFGIMNIMQIITTGVISQIAINLSKNRIKEIKENKNV